MHYDGYAFTNDNRPTILDKKTGEAVELNKEISPQDFVVLNIIYPSKGRCSEADLDNLESVKELENEYEIKDVSDQETGRNTTEIYPKPNEAGMLLINTIDSGRKSNAEARSGAQSVALWSQICLILILFLSLQK